MALQDELLELAAHMEWADALVWSTTLQSGPARGDERQDPKGYATRRATQDLTAPLILESIFKVLPHCVGQRENVMTQGHSVRLGGIMCAVLCAALGCRDAGPPGPNTGGCKPACSPGYICNGTVCEAGSTGGCNPTCSPGYTCRGNTCERDTPIGCNPTCSSGFDCQGTTCVRRMTSGSMNVRPGGTCTTDSECCGDSACTVAGVCVGGAWGRRRGAGSRW